MKQKEALQQEKLAQEKLAAEKLRALQVAAKLLGNYVHDSVPISNDEVKNASFFGLVQTDIGRPTTR